MQKDKFTVSLADLEIESLIGQDNASSSALWDDPENLINIQFEDSSDGQSSPIQVTVGPQPEKIFHPQQDLFRSYCHIWQKHGHKNVLNTKESQALCIIIMWAIHKNIVCGVFVGLKCLKIVNLSRIVF